MIKYLGEEHLNSNFYKEITLIKDESYIKVETLEDEEFEFLPKQKIYDTTLTEDIKNLDDYNKVKEIVLYFLRNNTISEIVLWKNRIVVNSTSSRTLTLNLDINCNELINIIIEKYINDRYKFMEKNKKDYVCFKARWNSKVQTSLASSTKYSKGYNENISSEEEVITYDLMVQPDGNIAFFDKMFFINYIKEMMSTSENRMVFMEKDLKLFIEDKVIVIPRDLVRDVRALVRNRNEEIKRMNEKQYRLEI